MSGNYREYGYDVNSPQLYGQVQEDAREAKEIGERAEKIRNEKGEEIAKDKLGKEEVTEEEIKAVVNYCISHEKEYVVDGAILTCDKAKLGPVKIKIGNAVVEFEGNNSMSCKYTRLNVKENGQSDNGLYVATIGDAEKDVNIVPFRCNCSLLPDRQWEIDKIKNNLNYCKTYGTCGQLMDLDDEWDNLLTDTSHFTYTDVSKDGSEEKETINMMSMLFCKHGGLITPVSSGQIAEELVLIYKAEADAVVSGKSGEKEKAAQAGVPVKYNISTYLDKKFEKNSPCYYIVNHNNTYIDENSLLRISKISGIKTESDYYCVAMAPGFTTAAEKYCTPAKEGNVNFGYKLQICLSDKNENEYSMDVVVTTLKGSSDINDFYPHDNLVEFVVDDKPKNTITTGGNVSFDKLLGGNGLEITEVYAYEDGAMVTGGWWPQGHWEDR